MIQLMYFMCFMTSIIFMQINHPLAMGLTLLMQTILICLLTGMMTKSFWFSYILFLIFLGGMLVLFIYVTSLASNEMFSFSSKIMLFSTFCLMNLLIFYLIFDNLFMNINLLNNEMNPIHKNMIMIKENSMMLNKLYNFPTNSITILLINYLLITLIAIVKITKSLTGPLRTMN